MNSERGCVLIGVKKTNNAYLLVEGIQLADSKKKQIKKKIKDIRKKSIFPLKQKK
jgi:hypothetical protein